MGWWNHQLRLEVENDGMLKRNSVRQGRLSQFGLGLGIFIWKQKDLDIRGFVLYSGQECLRFVIYHKYLL